jgi:hypothetical protein
LQIEDWKTGNRKLGIENRVFADKVSGVAEVGWLGMGEGSSPPAPCDYPTFMKAAIAFCGAHKYASLIPLHSFPSAFFSADC